MHSRFVYLLQMTLLLGIVMTAPSVSAVTPDIRLPPWHKLESRILSWDGKGDLVIEIEMHALKVRLHALSAKIGWPKAMSGNVKTAHADVLEPGGSWKSSHIAHAPATFDGWIELDAAAFPDATGLETEIRQIATYTEMMRAVLLNEAKNFKTSIPLGRSIPLHLDENIAALLPRELLFSPTRSVGTQSLFFWAPPGTLGTGPVADAFAAFRKAIHDQDDSAALTAIGQLEKDISIMPAGDVMLSFKTTDGSETGISRVVVLESLTANRACLEVLMNKSNALQNLSALAEQAKNRVSGPFVATNLGVFYKKTGRSGDAVTLWRQALALNPAWPLVRTWLRDSSGGKK
ncbi:MAG: hypothetical protein HQM09_15335 [Candidatus Riflebacteria bacterium]|nr:hypothetical protein [Candidatus Riflebacteria bacterium]